MRLTRSLEMKKSALFTTSTGKRLFRKVLTRKPMKHISGMRAVWADRTAADLLQGMAIPSHPEPAQPGHFTEQVLEMALGTAAGRRYISTAPIWMTS